MPYARIVRSHDIYIIMIYWSIDPLRSDEHHAKHPPVSSRSQCCVTLDRCVRTLGSHGNLQIWHLWRTCCWRRNKTTSSPLTLWYRLTWSQVSAFSLNSWTITSKMIKSRSWVPTNSIAALQCDPCTLQFGEKKCYCSWYVWSFLFFVSPVISTKWFWINVVVMVISHHGSRATAEACPRSCG